MKVILYMAISANGYITTTDNKTPWSTQEWHSFSKHVKKHKNLIIGRKTYEIMKQHNEFKKIGNPFIVVITSTPLTSSTDSQSKIHPASSPLKGLQLLQKYGFTSALVGGGATLNTSFLNDNLIDELYLDIEPVLFGQGILLFSPTNIEKKLQLLNTTKLSKNTIQLHYQIKKYCVGQK